MHDKLAQHKLQEVQSGKQLSHLQTEMDSPSKTWQQTWTLEKEGTELLPCFVYN
jgi:hypothetical protein